MLMSHGGVEIVLGPGESSREQGVYSPSPWSSHRVTTESRGWRGQMMPVV